MIASSFFLLNKTPNIAFGGRSALAKKPFLTACHQAVLVLSHLFTNSLGFFEERSIGAPLFPRGGRCDPPL